MEFTKLKNQLERPYVVYADFECTLVKPENDNDTVQHNHKPNSVALYLVCSYDNTKNELSSCVGEDCVSKLLVKLNQIAEKCIEDMQKNQEMVMDAEDIIKYNKSSCCHICKINSLTTAEKLGITII